MKRCVIAVLALGVVGCGNPRSALLGNWEARLVTDAGEPMPLKGSLHLYATKDRFTLHFDGPQQGMDASGMWSTEKDQIHLEVRDLRFDDRGGSERRDPNRPFVPFDDLRRAFQGKLSVSVSSDRKSFTGPLLQIGSQLGRLQGKKAAIAQ